ncbi:MAG: septum formation family protein [Actinomycetota bacterium]
MNPVRRHLLLTILLGVLLSACGPGEGAVSALQVGQCLHQPEASTAIEEVELVPCDDPHDFEVFALVELPDGPYPGDSALPEMAQPACRGRFAAYVGVEPSDSVLATGLLVPSEDGWDGGDREVVCLLYEPDERLQGSMRATGR